MNRRVRTITTVVLVAAVAVLIGYDVYALIAGGDDATISRVTVFASIANPVIAFGLGFVCGHLMWPKWLTESKWVRIIGFIVLNVIVGLLIAFDIQMRTPVVPFALGFACGRLVWPQRIAEPKPEEPVGPS